MNQSEKKPVKTITGRSGMFGIIMLMSSLCFITNLSAQTTQTFTSSGTFIPPAGVTSVTVQAWGAGGGGSSINFFTTVRGGGGGGGAYASSVVTVVPGTSYNVVVGTGGGGSTAGGNSTFNTNSVIAAGGSGGTNNSSTAGAGGTTAASTGTTKFAGGNGAAGGSTNSGGGGGGAGTTGAGGPASGSTAGTGTSVNGGVGGTGVSGTNNGTAGSIYGGGGSGAASGGGFNGPTGGSGANGLVTITYTCPTYSLSSVSVSPNCQSLADIATLTASPTSGLPSGTYTVTYNLSGANTANGATATMTVTTTGTGNFTIPASQIPNTGATSITITTLASGLCSSTLSANNTANISVLVSPTITSQTTPAASYCLNSTSTPLSVVANGGSSTISQYQWFSNTTASTTGGTSVAIHTTSSTTDSYTPITSTAGTLYYYVVITNNNNCTVTSAVSGAIQVYNATTITSQPSTTAANYCQTGSTVTPLSVTSSAGSGNAIAQYQWFSNTTPTTTGGTVVQTTSTTSTTNTFTPPLTTPGTLYYYVVVTNNHGCTVTSNISGAITVNSSPSVTSQTTPAATYCQNSPATALSVTANPGSGATISSYQWFSNTTASTTGGTLVATDNVTATTDTYTPLTTTVGTLFYYVIITNSNNCTIKSAVSGAIKVQAATAQPVFTTSSANVCLGQNNVAYIVASDPNVDSYTWSYSGTGATINGSTNSVTINFSGAATSGTLSVTPHNSCGDGTPQTLAITVNPVAIGIQLRHSNATSPISAGSSSTVTIQSSTLATGTYTVVYNSSAPNSATGLTASMSFTAGSPGSGTFSVPLANGGVSPTTITITSLQNTAGCSSAISTNNTANILVNPTSWRTNIH